MATGTLTNNAETFDLYKQNNVITLSTNQTYVNSNIELTTKVHAAILKTEANATDYKTFSIQIPNGNSNDILLVFTTDTDGNTTVTGSNVS